MNLQPLLAGYRNHLSVPFYGAFCQMENGEETKAMGRRLTERIIERGDSKEIFSCRRRQELLVQYTCVRGSCEERGSSNTNSRVM